MLGGDAGLVNNQSRLIDMQNHSEKITNSQWLTLQKGRPVLFSERVSQAGQVLALFVILLASYKAG
ncbi:hypothetical protein [Oceanisphaera sp. KMM 10153]|uniref:hypothetical protein n=1 Tax=Oceanisphaera submarina TaxID=3390193 RepID=UPI003974BA0D